MPTEFFEQIPAPLRDLFIRIAQAGLVRARWTETIYDELEKRGRD